MTFREGVSGLTRFGKRWCADARKSLVALGLEPPGLDGNQIRQTPRTCRGYPRVPSACADTASGVAGGSAV